MSAAPAYVPSDPPPEPPARPRRRGWVIGGLAAWAVLLLLLGAHSAHRAEPTVREQRDIGQATPLVDRAIGELVAAAGPDVVLEMAPHRLVAGCRLTPVRDGAELSRRLTIRTADADGPAVLDRIAAGLPPGYDPQVWHSAGGQRHELRADGGEFVTITGRLTEPGLISISVTTGCRPTGDSGPVDLPAAAPVDVEPGRVLAALGATAVTGTGDRIGAPCPAGGYAHTVRATGEGEPPTEPGRQLGPIVGADAVVVIDSPNRYAYRSGQLSVLIEASDGTIRVAATTGC